MPEQSYFLELIKKSSSRTDLWNNFIKDQKIATVAEFGVYKGDFAQELLKQADVIQKYYMIDPWRHLQNWNKPANINDEVFTGFYNEAMQKTDFAVQKRIVLRGTTTEVIDQIEDDSLDFAYIDGDHTLRGITIDLISILPKVKTGGWIAGDDFCDSIWQHPISFEPTLIFPYTVYFAEAISARLYGLPYKQFLIEKNNDKNFSFIDFTNKYKDLTLKDQLVRTLNSLLYKYIENNEKNKQK